MIIKIQVTGPRASGKSTILDQIESFLQIKGFEVKRTGKDGHGLLAKTCKGSRWYFALWRYIA
jgi:nucleoside-triphosphatase THEP1